MIRMILVMLNTLIFAICIDNLIPHGNWVYLGGMCASIVAITLLFVYQANERKL